jgi:hypothetical protein
LGKYPWIVGGNDDEEVLACGRWYAWSGVQKNYARDLRSPGSTPEQIPWTAPNSVQNKCTSKNGTADPAVGLRPQPLEQTVEFLTRAGVAR